MRREGNQSSKRSSEENPAKEPQLTGVGLDHWGDSFPTTHWSLLFEPGDDGKKRALTMMCRAYWYPLYAYLRKTGHSGHDAQDLTQGFFVHLFSADRLANVDPHRGRFRSYLLGTLKHYVSDVRAREHALKRGGGTKPISIEQELAEERYQNEPADERTAENLFDRQWALEVFRQVLKSVENDYTTNGKRELFEILHPYLTGDADRGTYGVAAEKLGVKEVTVRSLISRLRKHYRRRIRELVEQLVDSPKEVEEELQYLFEVLQ